MRKDISCFVVYIFKSETNEKNPEFIFLKSNFLLNKMEK